MSFLLDFLGQGHGSELLNLLKVFDHDKLLILFYSPVVPMVQYRHSSKYLASDVPRRTLLVMLFQVTKSNNGKESLDQAKLR